MKKKALFIVLGSVGIFLFLVIAAVLIGYRRYTTSYVESGYGGTGYGYDSTGNVIAPDIAYDASKSLASEEMVNNSEGSKVQKNGSMSFLVESINDAIDGVKSVNEGYEAQITNIYDYGRGNDRVVQITIKVPVKDFEAYYEELRKIDGEVTYANISTTDVTEEYIDITSRLTNLKSVEAQLVDILEKADTVTDILAVQRELNTVRGDIESYEQRKRYFDSQTDYSYISLTFSIDKTGLNITEDEWKPWGEFKSALKSLVDVLKGFVNLTIWLVVFSPLVLIPIGIVLYIVKRKKGIKTTK